jgi:perosamine synthetase
MPNLNAALGCAQMEVLADFVNRKRKLAGQYGEFFSGNDIEWFHEPPGADSNYWLNAILLPDKAERDRFLEISNANGVMTRPLWVLLNDLPMYRHCHAGNLATARRLQDRIVNIPSGIPRTPSSE